PAIPASKPTDSAKSSAEEYSGFISYREEMPLFPSPDCVGLGEYDERKDCSDKNLLEFIYSNIEYPSNARDLGVEGMVVISFDVHVDGTVHNPRIARDLGGGCGEEALRVIQLMIDKNMRWTPASAREKPVQVQFNMPVKFKLE
ncbi:MAG: energy transducer TonB, partial [Bacteroidota bacterium]